MYFNNFNKGLKMMPVRLLCCLVCTFVLLATTGNCVYVDFGYPYNNGSLEVGELTLSKTISGSPKHTKVYYPLQNGTYAVIFFIGGLNTLVPAELYSIYLNMVASHGFYVFGVDYDFPATYKTEHADKRVGQDIEIYFKQLDFLMKYMQGRTLGVPSWDDIGLLCHSAGCDSTLKMVEMNQGRYKLKASAFLEPFSQLVRHPVNVTIPALMYGTELAEKGITHCNVKGYDYQQFYKVWKCPRIAVEVAEFGHCDMLDPVGWEACHLSHFCTTTNNTRLVQYRQFVQGVTASFFITMLQGRTDALQYITDQSKSPLRLLVDISDLSCNL